MKGRNATVAAATAMILAMSVQADSEAQELFHINFESHSEDNLHWTAPSYLSVDSSGYITLHIAHAANMRRTGQFFDAGSVMCVRIQLEYFADDDCAGPLLDSQKYEFFCLGYKREIFNMSYTRGGSSLSDLVSSARCIRPTRTWESPFG